MPDIICNDATTQNNNITNIRNYLREIEKSITCGICLDQYCNP